jgi:hypothetical protein
MAMPRIRHLRAGAFVLCALAGGCAQAPQITATTDPAPAAPPAAAPAPATGPASTDGLYKGTSTRYQADRRDCPHPGLVALYVQGGQFTYRWDRETDVLATLQPDGSIIGQDGRIALSGRLNGSEMQGDLTNGACALHFTAERRFAGG